MLATISATLDGLDVAMCAFDADDRTVLWNRAFLRMFPEHLGRVFVGEPYRDNLRRFYAGRLGADEAGELERFIDEGIARHHAHQRPYTFRHKTAWLRVSSAPLPAGGRVRVWRREPTPRLTDTLEPAANPQQAVAADNAELFEHVGDGVMLTNAQNRITWVNEHFVEMFRLPDKAAALDRQFETIYAMAWSGASDSAALLFEAGMGTLTENLRYAGSPFELPLPRGRWVRVIEQRRHDGVGFFALVDISLLKRQHEELIAAERRARESSELLAEKSRVLEVTLQRMEQGIMMVNAEGIVEVCNRRAIELLELPPELMASRPTFSQVLEYQWSVNEFSEAAEDIRLFVRSGGIKDQPQRYERKRPNGRVIEIQSVPLGRGGVLRSYTDITDRKRAEATQQVLESQLREAQKLEAIGTLAGGIAHDFNNIMAAILGNVAFAEEAVGASHPAQPYLADINKAGRRARSLVQQILAFSRRESGDRISFRVRPLVEETIAMLRSTMGPSIRMQTSVPDTALAVMGNPTQVQQVLMNLGTNALQAMAETGGVIEVGFETVHVEEGADASAASAGVASGLPEGDYVRLWVRDTGHGMDQATRDRIFEPFFTTKPVGVGTGLGLAVVHGIIEAHGGEIVVESAVNVGSTFSCYLPAVDYDSQSMPLDPLDANAPLGQGQHVLYVDDDEVMTVMVCGLLERLGYRATCALGAQEALAIVSRNPADIDLVVTDFNMPNWSGLDLVRALARVDPELPVAISSGYISDELRANAAELGVAGLMQKEHTLEELGRLVHGILNRG